MADTITILVATDNHVGAHERDPIRGDDSWKTFHEIMCLAKERDVDMVLLAGDLFHDNKPSRKAMYNVMRSLRLNCLGDKPCELEMLSDESEHFDATFDHVNYEDQNINVAIPVFSIHGNHDDPTGQGHYAALDLLAVSGLVNYYGKTPQSDNINVKPVLIQKGHTKLALYGLSNVRDERLYRTFRDGKVKFHRPGTQMNDWYNIIQVHQNHHAYTPTSHLPENFLPNFLDLVIWGHEHECDIQPHLNPEMNFHVMQPGSSIATSLIPGEAAPKHVAILKITGKEMEHEPIRLKTVRPFVYKDLVLANDKVALRIAKKDNHRSELTRHLISIVEGLIEEAKAEWREAQGLDLNLEEDPDDESTQCPLPLVRLRVETTSPDGVSRFDVENPQRFSNRFASRVANTSDVIHFHVKKRNALAARSKDSSADNAIMAKFANQETIKVEKLVREFLQAQSLTILPQNYFGDAVNQYVVKDDKHAMEVFVNESLAAQIKQLVNMHANADESDDDEDLAAQINEQRAKMEEMFAKGALKTTSNVRFKPKPANYDSELEGPWEQQPAALRRDSDIEDNNDGNNNNNDDDDDDFNMPISAPTRGRGRGRGRGGRTTASTATTTSRAKAAPAKKPTSIASTARSSRRRVVTESAEEDDEEAADNDVVMLDDNDDDDGLEEDDSQAMFFPDKRRSAPAPKPPPRTARAKPKQSTLSFTTSQNSVLGHTSGGRATRRAASPEDDDDDSDAFEPASASVGTRAGTRATTRRR